MKLNKEELTYLREMIKTTSSKVLEKYKNQNVSSDYDYLFIGDSIIEYFNLKKYLPGINAINRGVAGATTKFILDNLDTIIDNIKPIEIFISIGSNDLVLLEATVEEAYLGIVEVFEKLKLKYPETKINYLSTTPVVSTSNVVYKKIYIGGRTNDELRLINEKVKQYAKANGINYIHLFDALLDADGYLKSEFTADGIHLNSKGYEIYSNIIKSNIS